MTVLLLHGQPGSGGDWAGVVANLREAGVTAHAPDRPGYGGNELRAGGFEYNARALERSLDDGAVVAGHSWGAGVALAMALLFPERVRGVVLVAPVTPGDQLGRIDRALADRRIGPLIARAGFLGAGALLAAPRVRRRIERALPGSDPARLPDLPRSWRSFWVEQRALFHDLAALDGEVGVPVSVVVGTRDHVIDLDAARRYASETGARLVELAGAGHLLPMQRPVEVAGAIAEVAITAAD